MWKWTLGRSGNEFYSLWTVCLCSSGKRPSLRPWCRHDVGLVLKKGSWWGCSIRLVPDHCCCSFHWFEKWWFSLYRPSLRIHDWLVSPLILHIWIHYQLFIKTWFLTIFIHCRFPVLDSEFGFTGHLGCVTGKSVFTKQNWKMLQENEGTVIFGRNDDCVYTAPVWKYMTDWYPLWSLKC